tara:strand:- start:1535 stop:1720 length:186 start_codon:yes stop_codon:yes gene_type:complete
MGNKKEYVGQKVQFYHRSGTIRGVIVEVDDETFVIATLLDETIRFRIPYSFIKNSQVRFYD